jgi:preprotein translocase subunit SecD
VSLSQSKSWLSPFFFWMIFACAAGYYFYTHEKSVKYGIDLVGGTYITLQVQLDKALEHELIARSKGLISRLKKAHLGEPINKKFGQKEVELTFATEKDVEAAYDILSGRGASLQATEKGTKLILRLPQGDIDRLKVEAVQSDIRVLENRVNAFGVGEVPIVAQGHNRIVIELPDVQDPQRAKKMIGRTAELEIKLVEDVAHSHEALLDKYDQQVPEGFAIVPGNRYEEYYLLPTIADLSGRMLRSARLGIDDREGATVKFEFNSEGSRIFHDLTAQNIGQRIAIVLDGVVISAPNVQGAISGSGRISGGFTVESASELATLLRSGAFAAPVTFEEERRIGPGLGKESIHNGLKACLVGLGLLFAFSVLYYKLAGLFAFFALLYNLLLVFIGLSMLGATLTLPGIAGLVLTVGMAIDASILIFEKIKEDLAEGMTPRQAVRQGFKDARTVILDANITTFIVGIVLYKFGTGPLQGFAATLMVGIIATLITGLFFLKSLFTLMFDVFGFKKLWI